MSLKAPLTVGLLYSQTGPTAYVERTQANATLLAIEEVNRAGGVCGREVLAVNEDARSDPACFAQIAERMLGEDHADLLIGCYMSSTRQAVLPVAVRRGAMLGYAAPYEGFEYSPNVIYGGAVPNQHILRLARHVMARHEKRFYFVGTRYTFPIESNRVMMTLVAEQKGKILAEKYVRLAAGRRELEAVVADIKAKQPDVVFCTVVGEAAAMFYRLCRDAGIPETCVIASLTIAEAETALMEPGLTEGHLTAATWFQAVDTPESFAFMQAYAARFGDGTTVNTMAETAYGLTHMLLRAADAAGSAEPDAMRAALPSLSIAAPQGSICLDADNNHCYLWPRIARSDAFGKFEIIEECAEAAKPDPYLINHSLADWQP